MKLSILNLDPTRELQINRLTSIGVNLMPTTEKMDKLSHFHDKNVQHSYEIKDEQIKVFIKELNNKNKTTKKGQYPTLIKDFEECGMNNFVLVIAIPSNKKKNVPSDLIFYDLKAKKKVKKIPDAEAFASYEKKKNKQTG